MSKIDIIIPVYNTNKRYLYRCIESLQAQTLNDWTSIIIDDGSNDETAHILDEYMKSDSRINVYHYPNAGPSEARNRGLEKVEAPYVTFLDSDDELTPSFLENGLDKIVQSDADLYICGAKSVKDGQVVETSTAEPGVHVVEDGEIINLLNKAVSTYNIKETLFTRNTLVARLVMKIYKKELLSNERLNPKVRISEDSLYSFATIQHCKRIVIDSSIGYQINITDDSLTRGKNYDLAINDYLEFASAFQIEKEALSKLDLLDAYRARLLIIFTNIQNSLSKKNMTFSEYARKHKELVLDDRFADLEDLDLSVYIKTDRRQVSMHKIVLSRILSLRGRKLKVLLLFLDSWANKILKNT